MVDVSGIEDPEFEWGKKKGIGGKKKDVQFYESFTFDGEEYKLYDCAYFQADDGDSEPYIGKIIKIWENADKSKKVKVAWFFLPCEISGYLDGEEVRENELVLASGEGLGLFNINPVETIVGKCNVVCISKDSRNWQPSIEELQKADHVFYRTFDVEQRIISDKIDEKIAGIEAKYFFNPEGSRKATDIKPNGADKENAPGKQIPENPDVVIDPSVKKSVDSEVLPGKQGPPANQNPILSSGQDNANLGLPASRSDVKESTELQASLAKQKSFAGEKPISVSNSRLDEQITANGKQDNASNDNIDGQCKVEETTDIRIQKYSLGEKATSAVHEVGGEIAGTDRRGSKLNASKDPGHLDDRPLKKAKLVDSAKVPDDVKKTNELDSRRDYVESAAKALASNVKTSQEKLKVPKDSNGKVKSTSKEPNTGGKPTKFSNGELRKASMQPPKDKKAKEHSLETTRKLDSDRSKWFKELPWEERLKAANEQGTLVLLQNFVPGYTSAEVEDLVRQALKETCTAKMLQQTAYSNRHYGQAFAIFKTREAAEMVVNKLDKGCLMLPNGRPVVASFANPSFKKKQSSFAGHLNLDRLKLLTQREMKEAVSTSHSSQPNTLEFDMALEWCLLRERSDRAWKKLNELQAKDLKKVKAELKKR